MENGVRFEAVVRGMFELGAQTMDVRRCAGTPSAGADAENYWKLFGDT